MLIHTFGSRDTEEFRIVIIQNLASNEITKEGFNFLIK